FFYLVQPPRRETIQELYQKLHVTGNLADLPKSGRSKSARTEENIERVRESVNADQSTSLRKRSQELCLRTSSLRNIIVNDLILKPSKIQFTHKMFESDASERLTFVRDIENLTSQDENFLDKLIMTDEAHF
uniref:Uncharacterized protein n=1 Tax=Strongyloides stercoralis TaxID=6248 RepID=A0AAF5DLT0_STRER